MKKILRLILLFAILLGFFTPSESIAKSRNGAINIEVVTTETPDCTVLYISPFLDSCQTDLIGTENVKEDESIGLAPLKSNFLLNANFSNSNFTEIAVAPVNSRHFVTGNMVPFRNIPRYILFHSLQIHF